MKKLALILLAILVLIVPMSFGASAEEAIDNAALIASLEKMLEDSDQFVMSDSDKAAIEDLKGKLESNDTADLSAAEEILVEAVKNNDFATDPSKAAVVNGKFPIMSPLPQTLCMQSYLEFLQSLFVVA